MDVTEKNKQSINEIQCCRILGIAFPHETLRGKAVHTAWHGTSFERGLFIYLFILLLSYTNGMKLYARII